jgi:assimilatory nitrate reductase catalytic subunit
MLWEGMCDMNYVRAHTEGFDALKETLREYTPEAAARICGVPAADIIQAAKWFVEAGPTLSMYCQGLNQSTHGTDNNAALINLHLATAQIGKPGAGPFSLTGQPNAMGGREVGGLSNLLSAHRDLANPEHRAEVAKLWGVESVPATPGKSAVEIFDAILEGKIKALWIACTNPAQSMPHLSHVHKALSQCEFVVLQEAFANTDTAAFADVLLPATTWGEKTGTVTNSERRITRVLPAVTAPGETKHDWQIAVDFAHHLGRALDDPRAPKLFPYEDAESIFNEHRETTRERDLDITGLSYAMLESVGPQQWPLPEGASAGKVRLYEDGVYPTPSGRARFANTKHRATAEDIDARFPIHLNTGRLRDQWHGMSRTGTVARLYNHVAEPLLSMNPADMQRRHLRDGDLVRVKGKRGQQVVRVQASADVRAAQVFMPMHWGGQFMHGMGVNALMPRNFDPVSKQPELKHAAVQIEYADLPGTLVAMRRFAAGAESSALTLMRALQTYLQRFDYATVGLAGRDDDVVVFRGFSAEQMDLHVVHEIDALLGLDAKDAVMRFADPRRGVFKAARVQDGIVSAVSLCGETAAQEWIRNMMVDGASAEAVRPWILAPISSPPRGSMSRGRIVCNCLDVAESEIQRVIALGADFESLQVKLKCGTQCGSCVPEVRRMCAGAQSVEQAA